MNSPGTSTSFLASIWNKKEFRRILIWAVVCYVIEFSIFKLFYPYPTFSPDSQDYLAAAKWNTDDIYPIRPIGYSKFLWAFGLFSRSDLALVAIQYFFLQAANIFFLFSLLRFLPLSRVARLVLTIFFLLNPMPAYISNCILSDSLFMGFSLIWFSLQIKMIYDYRPRDNYWNAALLLCLISIRYNAIYYPIVSVLLIILQSQNLRSKAKGIAMAISTVALFMLYTTLKEYQTVGVAQFSAFEGWQMANNALTAYQHVENPSGNDVPEKFDSLHRTVKLFLKRKHDIDFLNAHPEFMLYYIGDQQSPLHVYARNNWAFPTPFDYNRSFHQESPFFKAYGYNLLKKYPSAFYQYYLLPNSSKFFSPPLEALSIRMTAKDTVTNDIKNWFHYTTSSLWTSSRHLEIRNLNWYPFFNTSVYIGALIGLICFLFFGKKSPDSKLRDQVLWVMAAFLVINMGFSIYAASIVLRYQLFPISLCFTFTILVFDSIDLKALLQ